MPSIINFLARSTPDIVGRYNIITPAFGLLVIVGLKLFANKFLPCHRATDIVQSLFGDDKGVANLCKFEIYLLLPEVQV